MTTSTGYARVRVFCRALIFLGLGCGGDSAIRKGADADRGRDARDVGQPDKPDARPDADTAPVENPPEEPPRCVEDWPSAPAVVPKPVASLAIEKPVVLWRKPTLGAALMGSEDGGLVRSGKNLVLTTSNGIMLIDKSGGARRAAGYPPNPLDLPSSCTTDQDGNIFFNTPGGIYALNPDGSRKWFESEGGIPRYEGAPGPLIGSALALDPDGVLYGVSGDLQIRAFRSSDGKVLWRRPMGALKYPSYANTSAVLGGAGNALFVRPGTEATLVLDKRTGKQMARLVALDGGYEMAGYTDSIALGFGGTIYEGLWFFDKCGRALLPDGISRTLSATVIDNFASGTLDFGGNYAVYMYSTDPKYVGIPNTGRLSLYGPQGNLVRGPTKSGRGEPFAVGADGSLYTLSCRVANPPENRLYAYDSDLNELWHLDLGSLIHCPQGYGLLDDDGIIYFAIGNDVMAIQTKSPGLARTAWPMTRHDVRGTMWLVPIESDASSGVDASGTDRAIHDAGTSEGSSPLDSAIDRSINP